MKYKHFCYVDPQEPNITRGGLFIIQRKQQSVRQAEFLIYLPFREANSFCS